MSEKQLVAKTEVRFYDVWGDRKDGWEVNDITRTVEVDFPAAVAISGLPRFPGAKDDFREFPTDSSFSAEVCVSFYISDSAIANYFEVAESEIEVDGDGISYRITETSNSRPACEIRIVGWEEIEKEITEDEES